MKRAKGEEGRDLVVHLMTREERQGSEREKERKKRESNMNGEDKRVDRGDLKERRYKEGNVRKSKRGNKRKN